MTQRQVRRVAAGILGSAALAMMIPLASAAPAVAAAPTCSSASHPALAAKLSDDISRALQDRTDTVSLSVWDPHTGVRCAVHASRHFDSASAVKATIMAAVLRRAQEQHRGLRSWERARLHTMITYSDNDSASALWSSLGRSRVSAFLRLAGMSDTVPGPGGYWGLTQITSHDELRLLDVLTDRQDVLAAQWRAYGLGLMARVTPSQRWGTPYGTPAGVTAHNKNGWLPRATRGWRVHSIGAFTGSGRDYRMAVLTDRNATMDYGVETIDRVAAAVHRDLGRPCLDADRGGHRAQRHSRGRARPVGRRHVRAARHVASARHAAPRHGGGARHHR
jgi:hypothetical protein